MGYFTIHKIRHFFRADERVRGALPRRIVLVVMFALCTYYSIIGMNNAFVLPGRTEDFIYVFTMRDLGIIILSATCGVFYGVLSAFFQFLFIALHGGSLAYVTSVVLVSALMMGYFSRLRWFADRKKSFAAVNIMALVIGVAWGLILNMLGAWSFSSDGLINIFEYFISPIPEITIGVVITRLLFIYCPESVRHLFYMGRFYCDGCTEEEHRQYRYGSRIGHKITMVILLELIIITAGTIYFSNFLFHSGQETGVVSDFNVNVPQEGEAFFSESDTYGVTSEKTFGFSKVIYHFHHDFSDTLDVSEGFTMSLAHRRIILKLVLLMMNLVIPIGMITNHAMNIYLNEPITQMNDVMSRFYETSHDDEEKLDRLQKDLDAIDVETGDEIQGLHHSLLMTVDSMREYLASQEKTRQLEADLLVAEKSSEAKSSFLSNMSHEIRTPINAILGMDEIILRETCELNTHKYAVNIQNSGKALLSLINDILDFSKIEAGKMELVVVDYDMSSVVNDLINMIRKRAEDKGLELKVKVDPEIPYLLHGDDIRLKQCITNILTNAVKYTNEGSVTLEIGYREFTDEEKKEIAQKFQSVETGRIADNGTPVSDIILLNVHVRDTGIGIKEDDLKKLFAPFERIEETRNRTIEGTGLGMNITRHLLHLMYSELHVESEYGKGSDFSFEVIQGVIKREPIGDFSERYEQEVYRTEQYSETFRSPEGRILVVDDTEMNLTVIEGLLKQTLIGIDTAESGMKALEMVQDREYDVIFIDHRMPVMDGIETLHAMREMDADKNKNADTPCIALTANAVSGARDMYLQEGFRDYLSKPVSSVKLEAMLIEYMPPEKVHLRGSKEYEDDQKLKDKIMQKAANADIAGSGQGIAADTAGARFISDILHLDIQAGITNCGSIETMEKAYIQFVDMIPSASKAIETFLSDGDLVNYTVKVHALKSSARLIGALELSEEAAALEAAGNAADMTIIHDKTPALLAHYRSYGKGAGGADKADTDLPEIDPDELADALDGVREFVDAFDFASASGIVNQLAEYKLSENDKMKYNKLKELLAAADREGILELLSN